MKFTRGYIADFFSLLFPQLCEACNETLSRQEELICTNCLYNLPYTNFHRSNDHIVAQQFWGKLPLEGSFALFYFTKGGNVQRLMHHLKYRNKPQIGTLLGKIAGRQLSTHDKLKTADLIIPVPLHPSRLRKRGYNQSEYFAKGLAEIMEAKVSTKNLLRAKATETQTRKSRFERFENVSEVFKINDPAALAGKHILLVDDIMTTGSTLEACGNILLQIEGVKLSIATMAYAE
ncbi:ComF family protein [Mucilaginibacter agri]|uniref:ComF family protein n=1 Tax=Mucilaginibacter agri TaxID=2695265 RepID=A0A965ZG61_9SPHI|nr:ComF family protein [Mucilaginibacter agri]NCD70444.1 ComF family protein [Mucilaginibacter agri]